MNYLNKIENIKVKLKGIIMAYSFEELPSTINTIKELLSQLDLYDSISIVKDIEHNDILIDVMRETNQDFILYTDIIHREQFGPHFMKYQEEFQTFK